MRRVLFGYGYAIASAAVALCSAVLAARCVPLKIWSPVFPGMLVALSMLGAAVLVRLARNSPITTPTAFDDEDLKRFFDTLEELNRRLFWIFVQAVASILGVLVAVAVASYRGTLFGYHALASAICSGFLAFSVVWLVARVFSMARGDIGFVRLQREILQNSLMRQRKTAAEKIVNSEIEQRSPGGYGRSLSDRSEDPSSKES